MLVASASDTVYPFGIGLIAIAQEPPKKRPISQFSAIHIAISLALRTLFTSRSAVPARLSAGFAQPKTLTAVAQRINATFNFIENAPLELI
jgi:hypothetical protein